MWARGGGAAGIHGSAGIHGGLACTAENVMVVAHSHKRPITTECQYGRDEEPNKAAISISQRFGTFWTKFRPVAAVSARRVVFILSVIAFCGTAIMAVLGYIGYFTASVYPRIPAAVGGGRPTRVQLLLKVDSSAESLSTVLYPGDSLPPPLSTQHLLLFTTDATYIVIDPGNAQRTIEVSKDLIAAVRTR